MDNGRRKKISIMVPCFNEVDNVVPMADAIRKIMIEELSSFDYEILFIDNCSSDGTRDKIEYICSNDKNVKAIFNVTNFGQFNSPFYGLCQTTGDCAIAISCDFQDPVEMIPKLVEQWQNGHRIVSCVKSSSEESRWLYFLRTIYYKVMNKMSDIQFIEHFTGFGLYDKSFIKLLRGLDDNLPFIRGIVGEYGNGFNMTTIEYKQEERRTGKTHNNFYSLYDAAMLSFTSYTKLGLRLAAFCGYTTAGVSMILAVIFLIMKVLRWSEFKAGMAPIVIGMFFLGGTILAFLGFMGEYIMNINKRVINRPVVVEERRINFDEESKE